MENFLAHTPIEIVNWLNARGLDNATLINNGINYNIDADKIVIPVLDENKKFLFNKYRANPNDLLSMKYTYQPGSHVALYGIHKLKDAKEVIICEGEFDSLILEANGFTAVTSTGGAMSFQQDWAPLFTDKEVYVCFDNDDAGEKGILKVCAMIPHAKYVPLPGVGDHGDVTDFFVKLKKTAKDFRNLMAVSSPPPPPPKPVKKRSVRSNKSGRLADAKLVPLDEFLDFTYSGFARCPFHTDKTPSLKQYENNRWYCFSCGKSGDVVDIYMKKFNVTMTQAINQILNTKQDEPSR